MTDDRDVGGVGNNCIFNFDRHWTTGYLIVIGTFGLSWSYWVSLRGENTWQSPTNISSV